MRAEGRATASQNMTPRHSHALARGRNILHLEAEMVNGTFRVLCDEFGDRRVFIERRNQFEPRIGKLDENDGNPMLRQDGHIADLCSEPVSVDRACRREILDGDRDMVQALEHCGNEFILRKKVSLLRERRSIHLNLKHF